MNLLRIQICEDDEEIKTLLVKHGKQTALVDKHGFTGAFRTHITWADATTVYCVTSYRGYLLPSDNGYVALQMPFDCGTHAELAEVIRMFVEHGMDKNGPCFGEVFEDLVEAN